MLTGTRKFLSSLSSPPAFAIGWDTFFCQPIDCPFGGASPERNATNFSTKGQNTTSGVFLLLKHHLPRGEATVVAVERVLELGVANVRSPVISSAIRQGKGRIELKWVTIRRA